MKSQLTIFIIVLFLQFAPITKVFAACGSPAGVEGKVIYNVDHRVLQYCDGTDWIAMHGLSSGSGGCTNPSGNEGAVMYNFDDHVMQACAGNVWKAMGPVPGAGAPDLSTGLVAHWNLDEGSGTDAGDSANSHDGIFQGSPEWVSGQDGSAVNFNDNTDYIEIPDDPALEGLSALTLTAWINPQGEPGPNWGRIVHKSNGSTGDIYFLKYKLTSHEILFGIESSIDGYEEITTQAAVDPGTGWHHVAGVWDGKNMNIFIDGQFQLQTTNAGHATGNLITNNENVGIGRHVLSSARNFNGYIDDVRIYSRALTYDEIHAIYTSTGGNFAVSGCGAAKCGGESGERVVFAGGHSIGSSASRISGVYGADAWCQQEALYNGGLAGTYKAWIADSDAATAPATRFEHSSVPYVMTDGTQVADDWADLTDGTIDNNIEITETGVYHGGTPVVGTNVDTDGTQYSAANHCTDWTITSGATARAGDTRYVDNRWSSSNDSQCNWPTRLFCFEQPGASLITLSPCPARDEGTLLYNSANNVMQYCDGASWVSIGRSSDPCAVPSPVPGTECLDGKVYAGLSPDGNVKMFTTRCDLGETWVAGSCTGSQSEPPWNNGNTSGYVTTNVISQTTGAANTAALITIDSDSGTGGTQPRPSRQGRHPSAGHGSEHGQRDHYEPQRLEEVMSTTKQMTVVNAKRSKSSASSTAMTWPPAQYSKSSPRRPAGHSRTSATTCPSPPCAKASPCSPPAAGKPSTASRTRRPGCSCQDHQRPDQNPAPRPNTPTHRAGLRGGAPAHRG